MPKPDFVLRKRPLQEAEAAIAKLKQVVLFHPDPLIMKLPSRYCVCGQDERKGGKRTKRMICCDTCLEWFHFDCVGLLDEFEPDEGNWDCEWCCSDVDAQGRQAWHSGRKRAKYRYVSDRPVAKGATKEGIPLPRYSTPLSWEGRVAEIEEVARRKAVKKRKLEVVVQGLADQGGHHVVDAEGLGGLELRPTDDILIDDYIGAGEVDPEDLDAE